MLLIYQILVRSTLFVLCTVALAGCGQQGALYLPQTQGVHRATLPESLIPSIGISPIAPAAGASSAPSQP
ncbi:LPS translocon maturation chaperone LptM [Rhodoferax lithotrophicus]|uniref:LPS translocon maturation chaperone LptM n=1 Tax=Rhodoferax lithotrophicus TaxID=2798804 RepID=UPI001CC46709|nr:lipoprotein [Rhodoferax sp. MIZ03]